ncbi:MAG: hypothetical protein IIA03_01975 [Proteobacteria bacterium]|nr:hypothetical protein [Pseudomonadota bacterium]
MNRVITGAFAGILLVTFGAIASACGDSNSELSLDEYFTQLDVAISDLAERTSDNASEEPDPSVPLAEQGEILISFLQDFSEDVGGVFVDDLEALAPPSEAQVAHSELLQAARTFVTNAADAVVGFENATSQAEFQEAFDLMERGGSPEQACEKLQDIADENEIPVTLNCALQ